MSFRNYYNTNLVIKEDDISSLKQYLKVFDVFPINVKIVKDGGKSLVVIDVKNQKDLSIATEVLKDADLIPKDMSKGKLFSVGAVL